MLFNVSNALETLPVKSCLPNKKVGDRRLADEGEHFLPPSTRDSVCGSCDDLLVWAQPIWSSVETGVDDLVGIDPRGLVFDGHDTKV